MSTRTKRTYVSKKRDQSAAETKNRVMQAAKALFARRGIDAATITEIAQKARVAPSTIYALFKSKEGILHALMSAALFGGRYQQALARLAGVSDPVRLIAMTAGVARAIYESESAELGLIRGASVFSPSLRNLEQEFEQLRFDLQEERVKLLYARGKARKGLPMAKARRIVWMYTGRDVYRMLVQESGWTADEYEDWLSQTLVNAIVEP